MNAFFVSRPTLAKILVSRLCLCGYGLRDDRPGEPCRGSIKAHDSPRGLGQLIQFGSQDEKGDGNGGAAEPGKAEWQASKRHLRDGRAGPLLVSALCVVTLVGIGPAREALAWGRMAHRAATRLAETRLTPKARLLIRELLGPGESLADASTWADENNQSIPGSAAWHYVNVPISAASYSPRDCH